MLHVITAGNLGTMKELAEAKVHSLGEEGTNDPGTYDPGTRRGIFGIHRQFGRWSTGARKFGGLGGSRLAKGACPIALLGLEQFGRLRRNGNSIQKVYRAQSGGIAVISKD